MTLDPRCENIENANCINNAFGKSKQRFINDVYLTANKQR